MKKNVFKIRIARLSGNIARIKLGVSNKYEIEEQKQKGYKMLYNK
jgi:chaperonin GroEL (HSP60 family)